MIFIRVALATISIPSIYFFFSCCLDRSIYIAFPYATVLSLKQIHKLTPAILRFSFGLSYRKEIMYTKKEMNNEWRVKWVKCWILRWSFQNTKHPSGTEWHDSIHLELQHFNWWINCLWNLLIYLLFQCLLLDSSAKCFSKCV